MATTTASAGVTYVGGKPPQPAIDSKRPDASPPTSATNDTNTPAPTTPAPSTTAVVVVPKSGDFTSGADQAVWLDRHNWFRSEGLLFNAANMEKLFWDPALACKARTIVEQCSPRAADGIVGINLFMDQNQALGLDPSLIEGAMRKWAMDELLDAIPSIKKTQPEGAEVGIGVYNHYSQVVWAATTRMGCAYAICPQGRFVACQYDPSGNVAGHGWYTSGTVCSGCEYGTHTCLDRMCTPTSGGRSTPSVEAVNRSAVIYEGYKAMIVKFVNDSIQTASVASPPPPPPPAPVTPSAPAIAPASAPPTPTKNATSKPATPAPSPSLKPSPSPSSNQTFAPSKTPANNSSPRNEAPAQAKPAGPPDEDAGSDAASPATSAPPPVEPESPAPSPLVTPVLTPAPLNTSAPAPSPTSTQTPAPASTNASAPDIPLISTEKGTRAALPDLQHAGGQYVSAPNPPAAPHSPESPPAAAPAATPRKTKHNNKMNTFADEDTDTGQVATEQAGGRESGSLGSIATILGTVFGVAAIGVMAICLIHTRSVRKSERDVELM
ncbi:TPA: hypothetical protein N0F65_003261 [Lagenidium giganteum]|uniref:SCP domain-containing protein n=1 Tax=Lagenidium giganteum TaxID=4803 RepID=A0AAV2YIK1_9STRA|nr:TPA: hypothetical protein N0F65_003261 [Lagenidium giganteum]